jgi:HKD family nuclease
MGRRAGMEIWPVENTRSTVGSTLHDFIPHARAIDIATAFVTSRGLDEVLPALRKASYHAPVRIIAGVKECFTEPAALRRLLTHCRERGETFRVKVSRDPRFHWKAYYVARGNKALTIIGSSNLTADGLGAAGELNVALSLAAESEAYLALHRPFDKEWNRAMPLSGEWINQYEVHRQQYPPPHHTPIGPLRRLLGSKAQRSRRKRERHEVRFGILYCEGYFAKATSKIIEQTTHWDEKHWLPIAAMAAIEPAQRMVLFDFVDRLAYLTEVMDTETTQRTPDGKHFAALVQIKGTRRRRMTRSFWAALKAAGLIRTQTDVKVNKFVSPAGWERFENHFRR